MRVAIIHRRSTTASTTRVTRTSFFLSFAILEKGKNVLRLLFSPFLNYETLKIRAFEKT